VQYGDKNRHVGVVFSAEALIKYLFKYKTRRWQKPSKRIIINLVCHHGIARSDNDNGAETELMSGGFSLQMGDWASRRGVNNVAPGRGKNKSPCYPGQGYINVKPSIKKQAINGKEIL